VPRALAAFLGSLLLATWSLGARPAAALPSLALRPAGSPFEGPTDIEVSAIWWNPAALAGLRGLHVYASGQLAAQTGSFERAPIDTQTGLASSSGDRSFSSQPLDDVSVRYFGGVTYDFGTDTIVAGLSIADPFDHTPSFRDDGSGSSLRLPSQYHLAEETFRQIYVSVGLALKLHPRWLVGVSVSAVDAFTDYTFYRDTALDGGSPGVRAPGALCNSVPCGFENPLAAERVRVSGNGGSFWGGIPIPSGIGMNWGILFNPVERLWMGISYQHVFPLDGSGSGYERPYATVDALGATIDPAPGSGAACHPCRGSDMIAFPIPDLFHLGARIHLREDLELTTWGRLAVWGGYGTSSDPALSGIVVRLGGAPVTQGGAPEQIVLARQLRPQLAAEAGVRWRPVPSLRLGLSLIVESSAVPADSVSAEAIDGLKVNGALGGEWRLLRWLRLGLAYSITAMIPATPSPGAYDPNARVACVDSGYAQAACARDLAGLGLPSAAGKYTLYTHYASASLGLDF
jgi:hypothetical protein